MCAIGKEEISIYWRGTQKIRCLYAETTGQKRASEMLERVRRHYVATSAAICSALPRDNSICNHHGRGFRNCRRSADGVRRSIPSGMAIGLVVGISHHAASCSIPFTLDPTLRPYVDEVHHLRSISPPLTILKVGFIGLGRMGEAMSRRLLDGGHEVAVYNRTAVKVKPLVDLGAKPAASIGEVSNFSGAVFTMLTDDAAVMDVVAKPGGLRETMPSGGIHICAGTHSVAAISALQEPHKLAGQILIAAPVLGRPDVVAAGNATIVVAGLKKTTDCCRPLFPAIAGPEGIVPTAVRTGRFSGASTARAIISLIVRSFTVICYYARRCMHRRVSHCV